MSGLKRIPIVRQLEYLSAFLRGLASGGGDGAEKAVRKVMSEFELEKDRAVGLGKKIDEKKLRLHSLLSECMRMCKETGLIRRGSSSVDAENPDAKVLLTSDPHERIFRDLLTRRMIATYSSFGEILFRIRAAPNGKIYASHDREKQRFVSSTREYGIEATQWTFEAARDLATQLGLTNWRMLDEEETARNTTLGKTGYVVYLVCILAKLSELQSTDSLELTGFEGSCIRSIREDLLDGGLQDQEDLLQRAGSKNYSTMDLKGDYLFIKRNEVDEAFFQNALWRVYMRLTGQISKEPAYYSVLRDKISEAVKISDELFDSMIRRMIENASRYDVTVYAGSGSLPLEMATSRKNIPPNLVSDVYMVYLLMERKRRDQVG